MGRVRADAAVKRADEWPAQLQFRLHLVAYAGGLTTGPSGVKGGSIQRFPKLLRWHHDDIEVDRISVEAPWSRTVGGFVTRLRCNKIGQRVAAEFGELEYPATVGNCPGSRSKLQHDAGNRPARTAVDRPARRGSIGRGSRRNDADLVASAQDHHFASCRTILRRSHANCPGASHRLERKTSIGVARSRSVTYRDLRTSKGRSSV
jgi:hypothetical protein